MKKQITAILYGGLGNQMFQYAAARALSLKHCIPLYLDIEWFDRKQPSIAVRPYQLKIFPNITAPVKSYRFSLWHRIIKYIDKHIPFSHTICEPHFSYWSGFTEITPPAKLDGYWQSEQYFMNFQNEIREDFTFPELPKKALEISKHISSVRDAVSVHIRRGDYISNPQAQIFHGNLDQDYYNKALHIIKEKFGETTIFIFSDDPQWVRKKFDCCGHSAVIVELNIPSAPHHDMHLMSLCRHHIIANSSFSWWGAWLGKKEGMTLAPRKWFAQKDFNDYKDIYCKKWVTL